MVLATYYCDGCNRTRTVVDPGRIDTPTGWIEYEGFLFCTYCQESPPVAMVH